MMKKHPEGSSVASAGGSASGHATAVQAPADEAAWWQQHDQRVYQCIKLWVEQWYPPERNALTEAVGEVFGEHRASIRETLTNLKERIVRLETTSNFEERFTKLAREVKRGSEIPQGELLAKIEGLQCKINEPNGVADLDARFRELAERVDQLEKTNSLEARFTELAHEVKRGSEIPQSELLAKIEGLQRQIDELGRIADLDAHFRELAERVDQLEKTSSLEARFTELAHEVKRGSEGPQRQIDELGRIADLDAHFRELAERVDQLEKTNSLEARFAKLANEAKGGPEIQQSELLGLQRQLDELKRVAAQPGPQGPPGPPGKLQRVKEYVAECVHYEGDVVTHDGALWQAHGDTVHAPPHSDWVCLARAGCDGRDGVTPEIRGTFDVNERYAKLDIVASGGASFVARRDNPGIPGHGDGWQLLSQQGRRGKPGQTGERGPRGEKGDTGPPAAQFLGSRVDDNYNLLRILSDGTKEILALRPAFEQFLRETSE
jgi:hypothetical protein